LPKSINISYLLEPVGRNTAPAIALAVHEVQRKFGDKTVCLVQAADHLISGGENLQKDVVRASKYAREGQIVLFGVRPTSPEVGYGYIEVDAEAVGEGALGVRRFVEKPDLATAERFLANGNFYWNSGMFCFGAGTMAEQLNKYAPAVWSSSDSVYASAARVDDSTKFELQQFMSLPDVSIDYALMEKVGHIVLIPAGFGWTDVGSWDSVANAHQTDQHGNSALGISEGKMHFVGAKNTYVQSASHLEKTVGVVGLENIVVIDTPDALLVAQRDKTQQVKEIVSSIRSQGDREVLDLPSTVHRPWGTYASLRREAGYQVKRISVAVGQKLSLQYHHKRAEHWIVTQGRALVQIGDGLLEVSPGEHCYIPLGEKHRLTNIGDEELVLIEVQCGTYLGEDDIVRLDDIYTR
jgi:mannose-1-phosphate guanylyltransferase